MKISRVQIKNFRNIGSIDVQLTDVVTLIGENNSGKSNFLYALTLPFSSMTITSTRIFPGPI